MLLLATLPAPAGGQDFADAGPGGTSISALTFLEAGLPPAEALPEIEALNASRFGLTALATHAVAVAAGWRSLRVAGGVSSTGDPEIGWTGFGAALGAARERWGTGARIVARRDRLAYGPQNWGAEFGGAVWVVPERSVTVWASAPAMAANGTAPPLVRGLAMGAVFEAAGVRAWFEHEARQGVPSPEASHRAGVAMVSPSFDAWVEGLDGPLRAAVGVQARARFVTIRASIVSHPVLGETIHLVLSLSPRRTEGPEPS